MGWCIHDLQKTIIEVVMKIEVTEVSEVGKGSDKTQLRVRIGEYLATRKPELNVLSESGTKLEAIQSAIAKLEEIEHHIAKAKKFLRNK